MQGKHSRVSREWRLVLPAAFRASIPVLLGYTTLGLAFGLTLVAAGLPWWLSPVMAVFIFAGAAQFMAIGLMQSGAGLFEIALLTLLMNGRHAVYGLSLLGPFRDAGKWKPYLIFGLTDETYGLLTTVKPPANVDETKFFGAITALNQSYWVLGCTVGSIIGSALSLDTTGLDFALTALFIVLLVEQIRAVRRFEPYLAAVFACIVALFVSPRNFLLLSLALATGVLALLRGKIEQRDKPRRDEDGDAQESAGVRRTDRGGET
jgi:4-azaleucine resistance transporter AzlC